MNNISSDQKLCPNCQKELFGQFCFSCGQNQKGVDRFFWSIINEFFDNIFSKRSRVFLTLFYLLFRPGFLAVEYFSGRRARYIQPVKLYIMTSLLFFTFLSLSNYFNDDVIIAPHMVIDGENGQPLLDADLEQSKAKKSQEEIGKALVELDIGFLKPEQNAQLKKKLSEKYKAFVDDTSGSSKNFISKIIESAPLGLILLVPVFALVLKLFYVTSGIYYTQHLILTVYNHSFLFLILSISKFLGLLDGAFLSTAQFLTSLLEIWIVFYIFLSLKVAYQESWSATIAKFIFLGSFYFILFFLIFIALFLWNLIVF